MCSARSHASHHPSGLISAGNQPEFLIENSNNLIPPMLNTNSRGRRRCVSNLEFQFGRFELTVYAFDRRQPNDHVYCRSSGDRDQSNQEQDCKSGSHEAVAIRWKLYTHVPLVML
jgi:hypothetical protein